MAIAYGDSTQAVNTTGTTLSWTGTNDVWAQATAVLKPAGGGGGGGTEKNFLTLLDVGA